MKILENLSDNADGGVWQAMDYYPFGLPMASSYLPGKQRWQFGGKEMDRISGLDLLDFEARPYDRATGRFRNPDPLAEKYHPITPYLFCAANPLIHVDPTGEDIYSVDLIGHFHLEKKNDDGYDRIVSSLGNCPYIDVNKSFIKNLNNVNRKAKTSDSQIIQVTVSIVGSYENMDATYSFLKSNTLVEWSYVEMLDKDNTNVYYIGTTHDENLDVSQDILLDLAINNSFTIIHATHNHTNENNTPSKQDTDLAKKIQESFPDAKFTVVSSRQNKPPVDYGPVSDTNVVGEVICIAPEINKKQD